MYEIFNRCTQLLLKLYVSTIGLNSSHVTITSYTVRLDALMQSSQCKTKNHTLDSVLQRDGASWTSLSRNPDHYVVEVYRPLITPLCKTQNA